MKTGKKKKTPSSLKPPAETADVVPSITSLTTDDAATIFSMKLSASEASSYPGNFIGAAPKVIEEENLLKFIDSILMDKPLKWFESNATASHTDPLQTKMVFDSVIERFRPTVTTRTAAIADGLIYKMSAPYRHMKFWKSSRHAFKQLAKANALDLLGPLAAISEKIAASNFTCGLEESRMRYIAAMLMARVERLCTVCTLSAMAASHSVAHVALGHLVGSTVLLLALLSDIYKESIVQINVLLECYESIKPLLLDSRFPQSLRGLISVKKTLADMRQGGAPLSDMRQVVTNVLCMNDVDLMNAFISSDQKKVRSEEKNSGRHVERSDVDLVETTYSETPKRVTEDSRNASDSTERVEKLRAKKKSKLKSNLDGTIACKKKLKLKSSIDGTIPLRKNKKKKLKLASSSAEIGRPVQRLSMGMTGMNLEGSQESVGVTPKKMKKKLKRKNEQDESDIVGSRKNLKRKIKNVDGTTDTSSPSVKVKKKKKKILRS